jgi:LmbE family N-acetylglucosaminyl deacetylase
VPPDVVYLSPHLDDAILSCGASIRSQTQAGRSVLVMTIFAGAPTRFDISPLAAELHGLWGDFADPVALRRREDRKANRLLGARSCHLDYLDAIYRRDAVSFLYGRDEDLFGPPHGSDLELPTRIADSILEICSARQPEVFAPLGIGNHVDHQLLTEAALSLHRRFPELVFYEDYPYVEVPGGLTQALEGVCFNRWTSHIQAFDEGCMAAKIDAIATYASQIRPLFGCAEMMARRVRDYAGALASEQGYGERYWRLPATATESLNTNSCHQLKRGMNV